MREEQEYTQADEAFDRAESLRWKRELEDDEPDSGPYLYDNGDGRGWPR